MGEIVDYFGGLPLFFEGKYFEKNSECLVYVTISKCWYNICLYGPMHFLEIKRGCWRIDGKAP